MTAKTASTATAGYPVHRDRQGKPLLIVLGVLLLVCALVGFTAGVLT